MTNTESEQLLELVKKTQNRLRGRMIGLVESWGMDEKRERAMIQTIKGTSYDNEEELKRTLYTMSLDSVR